MLIPSLSFLCVVLIGFASHRASLCNVRAVGEVLQHRSAYMLWSLLRAMLWMAALTGTLTLMFDTPTAPLLTQAALGWALLGGLLFGLGAGLNGGCSLSTVQRLVDGDTAMLVTLIGFGVGVALLSLSIGNGSGMTLTAHASPWKRWPQFAPWALAGLLVWVAYELQSLWRLAQSQDGPRWHRHLWAPSYHLSVAAAVLGLAGGLLYALQGAWSYSNFLRTEIAHLVVVHPAPKPWQGVLVLGLIVGMGLSGWQRRSFQLRFPQSAPTTLRHLAAGASMGMGAGLVPGGNDTLLLSSLPAFSASAAVAYLAMLAGIALMLVTRARLGQPMHTLQCSAARCVEMADHPVPSPARRQVKP